MNYLANVHCPICGNKSVVAISGFGGELATRSKSCKKCGHEYFVHLLTTTSTERPILDGAISSLRDRIRWLQNERKKTYADLLISHEIAKQLWQEALQRAREMRDHNLSN